jgi:hypothetical protein
VELYAVRKRLRKLLAWRRMYMEDLAAKVAYNFPQASEVTVRLAFNRHVVTINSKDKP